MKKLPLGVLRETACAIPQAVARPTIEPHRITERLSRVQPVALERSGPKPNQR